MIKHLRYFLSPLSLCFGIFAILNGNYYPIIFIIIFDLILILGDMFLKPDKSFFDNPNPSILNLALYINFPLLYIFVFLSLFVVTTMSPDWFISIWSLVGIDLFTVRTNLTQIDTLFLFLYITPLFIATMGTNVGHELTHRKRMKFDMFAGNWLLALSWDCTFAIEHVYGHHKNVGYKDDPATASRGENLYMFILREIVNAHKDAWSIEIRRIKRLSKFPFSLKNKMIQGYIRSIILCLISFSIGGVIGLGIFLFWSFIAKTYLSTIDYIEHYGLVRAPGQPVLPKHSWNSNHVMSSSILYNLTRHSSHHEKANLKYWELKAYPDTPTLPYGYLHCLYLAYFCPPLFKKIMKPRLQYWDENYASDEERKIISTSHA